MQHFWLLANFFSQNQLRSALDMNFCMTIFLKFSILTHGIYQAIIHPVLVWNLKVPLMTFKQCVPQKKKESAKI